MEWEKKIIKSCSIELMLLVASSSLSSLLLYFIRTCVRVCVSTRLLGEFMYLWSQNIMYSLALVIYITLQNMRYYSSCLRSRAHAGMADFIFFIFIVFECLNVCCFFFYLVLFLLLFFCLFFLFFFMLKRVEWII